MLSRRGILALGALSLLPFPALAARPRVRFVVPHPAGGPLDLTTRLIADAVGAKFEKALVENRPGAGGTIGMRRVARAKGRDLQFVVGSVATLAVNPHLFADTGYDVKRDFRPLRLVASMPNVLVVRPDFLKETGVQNFRGFLDWVKTQKAVPYATGGVGSGAHMASVLLAKTFGLDLLHVPFQGAGPAQHSLLSGRTVFLFDNLQNALAPILAGQLTALAVASTKRSAHLPDVPTVAEVTGETFDIGTWYGILGNAALSDEDAALWTERLRTVLADDALRARIEKTGAEVADLEGEDFARFIERESAKYAEIVRFSGAKARTEARKDFFAGLFFTALGLLGLAGAADLEFGSLGAMGPGFFPAVVSTLLTLTGALLLLRGLLRGGLRVKGESFSPGAPLLLLTALLLFAFLLEPLGFLPASFVLVFVGRLAAGDGRVGEALLLALVLTALSGLLFIGWLEMPVPLLSEGLTDFFAGGGRA